MGIKVYAITIAFEKLSLWSIDRSAEAKYFHEKISDFILLSYNQLRIQAQSFIAYHFTAF